MILTIVLSFVFILLLFFLLFLFYYIDYLPVYLNFVNIMLVNCLTFVLCVILVLMLVLPLAGDGALHVHLVVPDDAVGYELRLYDLWGRLVRDLGGDDLGPGPREAIWDGRDEDGDALPAGLPDAPPTGTAQPLFNKPAW